MKKFLGMLVAAAALVLFSVPASADEEVDPDLTVLGSHDSGFVTAPQYGAVGLSYNSSTGKITVTITMNEGYDIVGGDDGIVGFNVNGSESGLSISNVYKMKEDSSSWDSSSATFNHTGSHTIDGFGSFGAWLTNIDGDNLLDGLKFTVNRTGGFSSANDLIVSNGTADWAVYVEDCPNVPRGYVADAPGTTVPEPGSLTLLGTGLIGLAGIIRRRLAR